MRNTAGIIFELVGDLSSISHGEQVIVPGLQQELLEKQSRLWYCFVGMQNYLTQIGRDFWIVTLVNKTSCLVALTRHRSYPQKYKLLHDSATKTNKSNQLYRQDTTQAIWNVRDFLIKPYKCRIDNLFRKYS